MGRNVAQRRAIASGAEAAIPEDQTDVDQLEKFIGRAPLIRRTAV